MNTASGTPWRLPAPAEEGLQSSVHPAVASTLATRGVPHDRWATEIDPPLDLDPVLPNAMDAAADRLVRAVRAGEPVAIVSDYDVDGASAAAVMADFFRSTNTPFGVHVPDRATEGYGVSVSAVENAAAKRFRLLAALDCGSSSIDALARAQSLGIETIVVDHHQIGRDENGEIHPAALAFVNPMRDDDMSDLQALSAGGLAYCLARETARRLRLDRDPREGLDLAALALTCDVMPYVPANRAIVREGLARYAQTLRPGLAALAETAGLKDAPTARALGWTFGPRINAAGRIGDAALGWRLLAARSLEEARPIAARLEALNTQRRDAERTAAQNAIAAVAETFSPDRQIVSASFPDVAPGLVGLVASRLREAYGRPAFAFCGQDILAGSARSIPGVDIGAIVRAAAALGLLLKGGGHAGAAGMTVKAKALPAFLEFASDAVADIPRIASEPFLQIDAVLPAEDASRAAWRALESLGPFGAGHEPPLVAIPDLAIEAIRPLQNGSHLAIDARAPSGAAIRGVAFRAAGQPLDAFLRERPGPLALAGALQVTRWTAPGRADLIVADAAVLNR